MTGMVLSFWCGQTNGKNKIAWLSWDKVCMPKRDGGLGFRDLKSFNLALLEKQGWRLQCNTRSMVHWVLKARYFPHSDFLHAGEQNCPSHGGATWLHKELFKVATVGRLVIGPWWAFGMTSGCLSQPLFRSHPHKIHYLKMSQLTHSSMSKLGNGRQSWSVVFSSNMTWHHPQSPTE